MESTLFQSCPMNITTLHKLPRSPNLGNCSQLFHPARQGLLIRPAMSTNGRLPCTWKEAWQRQSEVGAERTLGSRCLHAVIRLGRPTPRYSHCGCAPCFPFYGPSPFPCAYLLDHLVRQDEERRGERDSERLRRLEVEDQLELGGLLYGRGGW